MYFGMSTLKSFKIDFYMGFGKPSTRLALLNSLECFSTDDLLQCVEFNEEYRGEPFLVDQDAANLEVVWESR